MRRCGSCTRSCCSRQATPPCMLAWPGAGGHLSRGPWHGFALLRRPCFGTPLLRKSTPCNAAGAGFCGQPLLVMTFACSLAIASTAASCCRQRLRAPLLCPADRGAQALAAGPAEPAGAGAHDCSSDRGRGGAAGTSAAATAGRCRSAAARTCPGGAAPRARVPHPATHAAAAAGRAAAATAAAARGTCSPAGRARCAC